MHPFLFRLGGFTLHSYGLCMAIGILCAFAVLQKLASARGYHAERLSTLTTILVFSGIAGARLAYVLEHWNDYAGDWLGVFRIWEGGLMFYGSILLGGIVLALLCRFMKYPAFALLDLYAVVVPIGQIFGRIGCLLNGCCFGHPSDSWCAIAYPSGSYVSSLYGGAPVLPSQLFESAGCLLLFLLLLALYRALYRIPETPASTPILPKCGTGLVLAGYCVGYGILRSIVETTRGDPRLELGPLSIAQAISVGGFILAIAIVLTLPLRRPKETRKAP